MTIGHSVAFFGLGTQWLWALGHLAISPLALGCWALSRPNQIGYAFKQNHMDTNKECEIFCHGTIMDLSQM